MTSWSNLLIADEIRKFWENDGLKRWHSSRSAGEFVPRVLVAGNGLTRLAERSAVASDEEFSWNSWLRRTWDDETLGIRYEVAQDRGLSEPELLSFALQSHAAGGATAGSADIIVADLRKWTETALEPGPVHGLCVQIFDAIVTTNYDTLFERACKHLGYDAEVYVVEVDPTKDTRKGEKLAWLSRPKRIRGPQKSETGAPKKIFKYHGSFAIPDTDYLGGNLIAGFDEYRARNAEINTIIDSIILAILPDWRRKALYRLGQKLETDVVLLGHGLSFSDIGLAQFISRIAPRMLIKLDFGGDKLSEQRAASWGITHRLNLPLNRARGKDFRKRATLSLLKSLKGDDMHPQEAQSTAASPEERKDAAYVLMLGQASYGYVFRCNRPIAEHSHRIHGEYFLEISREQRNRAKELIQKAAQLTGRDLKRENQLKLWRHRFRNHRYNATQIQGQMLTPALLLDRWGIPSVFASIIGTDVLGRKVKHLLEECYNLDSSLVKESFAIDKTDHSYVAAFGGMRTLFDHCETGEENDNPDLISDAKKLISDLEAKVFGSQTIISNSNPSTGIGIPKALYLSKWLLKDCAPLVARLGSLPNRPLILYETGTTGTDSLKAEQTVLGAWCDIVLASPVVPMKIARAPITLPYIPDGENPNVNCFKWPNDRTLTPSTIPPAEWHEIYSKHQQNAQQYLAFHHVLFLVALACLGPGYIARCLFQGTPQPDGLDEMPFFPAARYWVVTAGEFGMFLFERPNRMVDNWDSATSVKWVQPPGYDGSGHYLPDIKVLNTLGCGDVSRGAFIGHFMRHERVRGDRGRLLDDPAAVEDCVKVAVAVGKRRTTEFSLPEFMDKADWKKLVNESNQCDVIEITGKNIDVFTRAARDIYINFLYIQSQRGGESRNQELDRVTKLSAANSANFDWDVVAKELEKIRTLVGKDDVTRISDKAELETFEERHFRGNGLIASWREMARRYLQEPVKMA